jgi:hypothetical protein
MCVSLDIVGISSNATNKAIEIDVKFAYNLYRTKHEK